MIFKKQSAELNWDEAIAELSKLNDRPFAGDMIQAILNELERREKCGKK